jgi:hypothetical protein
MTPEQYATQWPRYCRTCDGIGGHKIRQDRMATECPDCFRAGRCARCAEEMPKREGICRSCGWHVFNVGHALPGGHFV